MVPAQRIASRLEELARCTDDPPRLTRTFLSPALREAHTLVGRWMAEAGLKVRSDAIGNLIGRREGDLSEGGAIRGKTVLLGSHLDTVRDAGRFDGALGVVLAIEAVAALQDRVLPFALEVLGFSDEEGVRFQSTYLGSRVMAGRFDPSQLELRDEDGQSLEQVVREWGTDPDGLAAAARPGGDLLGYLEVHIEQGPVLQERRLPVGVVTAIAGQLRARLRFTGMAGHAGTVPMPFRRDALCAAAEFILTVERLAHETPGLVATVGQLDAEPGASNVIPGSVDLTLDLRHQDDAVQKAATDTLRAAGTLIARRRDVGMNFTIVQQTGAIPCDPSLKGVLAEAVAAAGEELCELPSGAGHDAVALSSLCPVAMLFVRCQDGISHHPAEFVSEADIGVALRVMLEAIGNLAKAYG
jgi:allantoate deiminase